MCPLLSKSRRREQSRRDKIGKTMHEFKAGTLHSGSQQGPTVTKKPQAVAIALNQARKKA